MINHSGLARSILENGIVVDMVVPKSPVNWWNADAETDGFAEFINQYKKAGITWASLTISLDGVNSIETTVKVIAAARNYFLQRPDKFVFISSVDDIHCAKQTKKLGINFNFQGTNPLLGDLNMVETYRRLGVGHMLMAYNQKNLTGDGCHERTNAGLSKFGERLIQEMNRVGMIVDATHTGYWTTMDMFEVSNHPVIFSHSNAKTLVNHDRNIRDDQIKACAKSGGVVGICGSGLFLTEGREDVSAGAIARHIDYISELVGPQHIGFGLDYVGILGEPNLLSQAQIDENMAFMKANTHIFPESAGYSKGPLFFARPVVIHEVAECLIKKGYSDTDIKGILGENIVRVCREVWV